MMFRTTKHAAHPGDVSMQDIGREIQREVQRAVEEARVEVAQERIEQAIAQAATVQGPREVAPQRVIDALQAQIGAVRAEIRALTEQLTPGTSDAREEAINDQLDEARDRLSDLERQLDRALGRVDTDAEVVVAPDVPFPFQQDVVPEGAVVISVAFFATVAFMVVGWPIARAFGRRVDSRTKSSVGAPDLSPRLDRIEQAVEAIAIEVERVSEGQRFTTKLMSELRGLPGANPLNDWQGNRAREAQPVERKPSP